MTCKNEDDLFSPPSSKSPRKKGTNYSREDKLIRATLLITKIPIMD
jgi:hypothetical protein